MSKLWNVTTQIKDSISTAEELEKQLFLNRGLNTKKEIEQFFSGNLSDFVDDLSIEGIEKAKKRIEKAIKNEELIVVYGDYDVDGLSAAAVVYLGLTSIGAKVLPYIPHREKEGYGLSKTGLDTVLEKGAGLIITVDNGIVALEQAKYAKDKGLDLIITDHHLPGDEKPDCFALVHSTKMCGAGVAWSLVRNLLDEEQAVKLLDLVALGTVCDLIPLSGVNRVLVKLGLTQLNKTDKVGLKALVYASSLEFGNLSAYHIGHVLGPRLNAIGRLEHSIDALRLLCTKDPIKANNIAQVLCETNDQKKRLTLEAITEAKELIISKQVEEQINKNILVVTSEKWVPGIIGLVAGRLTEEYGVPSIAIAKGEFESKGSARSVDGINIVETIRQFSDILVEVGGHPKAAGFTIENSKLDEFQRKMEDHLGKLKIERDGQLEIEAVVNASKANKNMIEVLDKFEPFGMGNSKPILASMNVKISDIRTVGQEAQHLKFKADGKDAIGFNFGGYSTILQEGQIVNLAYYLEINKFNGYENLQLKIVDLQVNG